MSKFLSTLFIILSLGLTVWRGAEAGFELWNFFRLNTETVAKIKKWQVEKISQSKFSLTARYIYFFNYKEWESQNHLLYFPNSYAANEALIHQPSDQIKIWLDRSCPNYTAIEKKFPVRSIGYALCSMGTFFYFIYLKKYLEKFK